jgi:DNA-binding MarR family transcriptional regulator
MDLDTLQDVGLLFRTINFSFREQVDAALAEAGVGLNFSESSALSILDLRPGSSGADVARHAMVSPQAMNGVLGRLATRKLVERRAHPSSLRADAWHVTAKGRSVLLRAREVFGDVMSRMLAPLAPADVQRLTKYLRACAGALEAASTR